MEHLYSMFVATHRRDEAVEQGLRFSHGLWFRNLERLNCEDISCTSLQYVTCATGQHRTLLFDSNPNSTDMWGQQYPCFCLPSQQTRQTTCEVLARTNRRPMKGFLVAHLAPMVLPHTGQQHNWRRKAEDSGRPLLGKDVQLCDLAR